MSDAASPDASQQSIMDAIRTSAPTPEPASATAKLVTAASETIVAAEPEIQPDPPAPASLPIRPRLETAGGASGPDANTPQAASSLAEAALAAPETASRDASGSPGEPVAPPPADAEHTPAAKKPPTLLELPVDILQLILEEIDHANDLGTMARTCSTLYSLSIPRIYSCFDIVWPDPWVPPSEGARVDALTYGLSTLCLGSAFARTAHRLRASMRRRRTSPKAAAKRPVPGPLFSGNDYAKYTRKFSLGNGPPDHTINYLISKDRGKMLGTLAAMAVAKMRNLENFVWDLPSGVLSDVFMALGSLTDFDPAKSECKLERVWVRWHNNKLVVDGSPAVSRASSPEPPHPGFVVHGSTMTPVGILLPSHSTHPPPRPRISYSESTVEFPTFSVVPPLKSLSVLDIDELSYLDELSVLIEKSHGRLEELRIGIAHHAANDDFVQSWDGPGLKQVDLDAYWPGENTIGDRRLGGVLGILVGRIFDISRKKPLADEGKSAAEAVAPPEADAEAGAGAEVEGSGDVDARAEPGGAAFAVPDVATMSIESPDEVATPTTLVEAEHASDGFGIEANGSSETCDEGEVLDKKLKISTLELERVPLSMQVMVHALDWSTITSLTILSCPHFDSLWRQLRKHFRPTPTASKSGYGWPPSAKHGRLCSTAAPLKYALSLKTIHTDSVRKFLLSFIKDTLRPNSLQVLFLHHRQDGGLHSAAIEEVFKDAVRPHLASLRKLLIDGDLVRQIKIDNFNRHRRAWDLTRDMIGCIASGRMRELRELSFSLGYRDWHLFLQALPNLPNLQALHIQNISDHITGTYSRYESAMQVADILTLRRDMKLAYLAIATRCFSVVEDAKAADGTYVVGSDDESTSSTFRESHRSEALSDTSSSDSDDGHGGGDDDDDDDDDGAHDAADATDADDDDDDANDAADHDDDGFLAMVLQAPRIRMREIFFYDDKVAIFKARHGRL